MVTLYTYLVFKRRRVLADAAAGIEDRKAFSFGRGSVNVAVGDVIPVVITRVVKTPHGFGQDAAAHRVPSRGRTLV